MRRYAPLLLLAIAGCSSVPSGPTVTVMPAPGKPFDVFQADNAACKAFARQEMGVDPQEAARGQVAAGAATGAVVGAVAGAAIGGDARAAASGAGVGAVIGTAAGGDHAERTGMTLQRRYDIAYQQCMYAKGNQVPGMAAPAYLPPPPPPPPKHRP